ncbi:MAG: hypothetical protein U0572_12880 [Phycisphaerales bacterium]
MTTTSLLLAASVMTAVSTIAAGDFVTVDLSSQINSDLRTYFNGTNYPTGGQILAFAGVPMALGLKNGNPSSLGAVQIPNGTQPTTFSFVLDVAAPIRLYTLINSAWGSFGANNGKVEVFGTNGAYASMSLVQGTNIRDHYQGSYQNLLSDPTVVPTLYLGGVRLDRQVLELPPSFAGQTVTELRFSGVGANPAGAAFLAGATFEVAAPCLGDLNGDAAVDANDLAILLGAWGTVDADLDGDGTTGATDLAIVLGAWGACP